MPRRARWSALAPNETYHLVARGNNKQTIFRSRSDYERYIGYLRHSSDLHATQVHHYVLMPNHVHMLVRAGSSLPSFMHAIQMPFAKYFSKKYEHVGHVWQGRYKHSLISNDAYLFACGNYIEMNPVRAGIVSMPEEWEFSSYRHYAFGEIDSLIESDPFYIGLAFSPKERQMKYRELITRTRR